MKVLQNILVVIIILFFFQPYYLNKKVKMDNVEEIPDWLKMNVDEALPLDSLNVWIPTNNFQTSSLIRVSRFPRKYSSHEMVENEALKDFVITPISNGKILQLRVVKNEQVSAQLALGAKQNLKNVKVELTKLSNSNGGVIKGGDIKVRYVKYVSVERSRSEYEWSPKLENIVGEGTSGNMAPNVVGDPLIETPWVDVPAYRAQPVWFTIKIPKHTRSGVYEGTIRFFIDGYQELSYPLKVTVLNKKIPDSIDYQFHLDMWVNPSVIATHYKLKHWSEAHWDLIYQYLSEYASAGGKNITTTITHEPWHKPWIGGATRSQIAVGYQSMVQWYKDDKGHWGFDFSIFNRYVKTATKAGITHAIHAFSMTPFHTNQSIHYTDQNDLTEKVAVFEVKSPEYRKAWSSFLQAFEKNLAENGLLERTYLAFDEKPEEMMQIIHGIIENAAPVFLKKIVIAGHPEVGENAENLSISYMFFPEQPMENKAVVPVLPTIAERKQQERLTTFYLCAEPAHPNTLTYSPAIEGRMIPWLALKYNTDGYLRWAFNNWTEDPYKKPVFIHAQGDDYQIYPGESGPVSSIRWELLKEGIEDYELIKVLTENNDIPDENIERAIELASRNQDGRYKKANDILKARNILLDYD